MAAGALISEGPQEQACNGSDTPGRRQFGGNVALAVAYTLQGSALLQRRDAVRDTLEQQLRSAILESVLRCDDVDVKASYVGCQEISVDWRMQHAGQSLTLFFNVGDVPADSAAALSDTLSSKAALQHLQLSLGGLQGTGTRQLFCQEGTSQLPQTASLHTVAVQAPKLHPVAEDAACAGCLEGGSSKSSNAGSSRVGSRAGGRVVAVLAAAVSQRGSGHRKSPANPGGPAAAEVDTQAKQHAPAAETSTDDGRCETHKLEVAKLSVLVQAVEAPEVGKIDEDGCGAVEASVPPRSKGAIPVAIPSTAAAGGGDVTTSKKQRMRMGRRLEGAIANRRADAKLPGAARLRRNWFCGVGGPYAEPVPQRLAPALQSQKGQPAARHQAAAAAALSAGHSTRDAGAALTVLQRRPQQALDVSAIRAAAIELQEHVQQEQQLQRSDSTALQHAIGCGGGAQLLVAGSSLRLESPRSPAQVRRAGSSGSTASVAASAASNAGLRRSPGAAAPLPPAASREALWRQRRPVALPLHWRAWDDHMAAGAALQQPPPLPDKRKIGAVSNLGGAGGSPADARFTAELGATKAAAGAPVVCSSPLAVAATGNGPAAAAGMGSGVGGADSKAAPPRAPLQRQPEPHAAATRPRSILKTSGLSAGTDSAFQSPVRGSSVRSTPSGGSADALGIAAAVADTLKHAGPATVPESSPGGDAAPCPDFEPRTPSGSPARKTRSPHVGSGAKMVPKAVSAINSTPPAGALWSPSKRGLPSTPEGIVRTRTQEFEARGQREALGGTGWPKSYTPPTRRPVKRTLEYERRRALKESLGQLAK